MRDLIKKILKESETDLGWVNDLMNDLPINIGDVFWIPTVEGDTTKKKNVRYVLIMTDIIKLDEPKISYGGDDPSFVTKDDYVLKYKSCDPKNVTYNPKDYTIDSVRCRDYKSKENGSDMECGYNWAKYLIDIKWWNKM